MDKLLLYLLATVTIWPFVLWGVGWLVMDELREQKYARFAAQEAWEWLRAEQRNRLCISPPYHRGEPRPHDHQSVAVQG
ncbi:hypothetical protein [Actinophytocola oryzae]|uniref:Uncharacterized protein n=1 Tax=Actinophytocola oryzae TaxID=502181 RepID=A0A4R7VWZ6_9PSEU|nr:hypothetical protein [Actinophytocola oryzae]TDV54175.1 hypothetical protein CLV71_104646 [Actinophytocola oryzae]